MITPAQRAEIRRLFYGEHWKVGTIAAQLGLHHETVRAAVERSACGPRPPAPSTVGWSPCPASPMLTPALLPAALEYVLAREDGKARCLKAVRELSQAFALAVPHPETVRIRDDVSLFQHVRAALSKRAGPDAKSDEERIMRCGRSSRGRWPRTAWWTSSPRPD